MDTILKLLSVHGPMRAARLGKLIAQDLDATPEAIRKRLSRAKPPVRTFPFSLLPKQEKFFYLEDDRTTERFWTSFIRDLRDTESVYGAAFDGLLARRGVVAYDEFGVISGAPKKQSKHVPISLVLQRLIDAGFVHETTYADEKLGRVVEISRPEIGFADVAGFRTRNTLESIMLDGLREWARKNGMASYNAIVIRGEKKQRFVGPYMWDLTGPSYLLPLRGGDATGKKPGFFVADVFAGHLEKRDIGYFLKKVQGLRATTNVGRVLPVLFAQGFSGEAITYGHSIGVVLASPQTLFGKHVANAFVDLTKTLANAAAAVSKEPSRLIELLENITEIEGAAGNLRGVLFELIVAFLVRNEGSSIDMGRKAHDPDTGRSADIDILLVKGNRQCITYECKGKGPSVSVTLAEVNDWIRRIPIFKKHIRSQQSLANNDLRFEFWTSGDIDDDALEKLKYEKARRTRDSIDWKDGIQVREFSQKNRDGAVTKAINEHFFRHPLAVVKRRS
jgi:hypothetical protein